MGFKEFSNKGLKRPASSNIVWVVAFVFIGVLFLLWHRGWMPLWVPLGHVASSLLAFILYWIDKAKARNNQWRISEKTLHLVEFCGGWPGALIAQQWLRHKNQKPGYQVAFWLIVLVNVSLLSFWLWKGYPDPKLFTYYLGLGKAPGGDGF